jgi:hypothetical protein
VGSLSEHGGVPDAAGTVKKFFEARGRSAPFRVKLAVHNTLDKVLTAGKSRWVSSAEVVEALEQRAIYAEATRVELRLFGKTFTSTRPSLRFLGARVDRVAGSDKIRILGAAGRGPYAAEAAEHELLHVGQLLRTPGMPDAGARYEIIPAVVGTPLLYVVTPTGVIGGIGYGVYKATE